MATEIQHFNQDYQSLKREVSRLASMANKRLVRLEKNGFEDSPAYKQWIESGGEKFSVRGKDYNELQKELARVRQFVNAKTSTIRGAQSVLKAIAANTGANFKGKELWAQASNFFRVSSMIEQYIRSTEDVASAIGYQKIWTAINQYTQANDIDLAAMQVDIEQMVGNIAQMLSIEVANKLVEPLDDMIGYVIIK